MMRIASISLFLLIITACAKDIPLSKSSQQSANAAPEYLQPYPNSKVIRSAQQGGEAGLEYEVSVPYPAESVIKFIESRVPAQFHPRKEDFINPGIPTSYVRGWTDYGDVTTTPHSWVHHWASEWEDPAGNILSYDLMYRSFSPNSVARPSNTQLHVFGTYYPREVVEEIKKSLPGYGRNAGREDRTIDSARRATPAVNAHYLVLRPVSAVRTTGAAEATLYGQTLYFQPNNRLLTLADLTLESVEQSEGQSGSYIISVRTNAAGEKKLKEWTFSNIGKQLGIFLDGRLISAPTIRSPISSMIILDGEFSKQKAGEVAGRLRRGGAV